MTQSNQALLTQLAAEMVACSCHEGLVPNGLPCNGPEKCDACNGTGRTPRFARLSKVCWLCSGKGYSMDNPTRECKVCQGNKHVAIPLAGCEGNLLETLLEMEWEVRFPATFGSGQYTLYLVRAFKLGSWCDIADAPADTLAGALLAGVAWAKEQEEGK